MKADDSAAEQTQSGAVATAPLPPPLPQRRPRVREVSSRFMSPLVSSNSTATPAPTPSETQRRSKSAQRRHHNHDDEPENIKPVPPPPQSIMRSSCDDTPFHKSNLMSTRKQRQLFRDNVGVKKGAEQQQQISDVSRLKTRLDTPTVMGTDRVVPSRFRQMGSQNRPAGAITPAAKLVQEAISSSRDDSAIVQRKLSKIATSSGDTESNPQPRSCPNSPICVYSNKSPAVTDTRSSMPESAFSNNCESPSRLSCSRSLDLRSSKTMGTFLPLPPPHPFSSKVGGAGLDARKGKKFPNQQEDLYALKLLHNHHLQWRYANAKAEASMQAQKKEAEGKLYALGSKIADLRDDVERKRVELATLRRVQTLTTILEGHIPYLDEWSDVEEDYSNSLTGIVRALLNTSLRLPVSGEVRADVRDLGEVLNSAKKVMEMIESHIQSFMPKAEQLYASSAELARVTGQETALIEECGNLMFKMHASQVNEWSLRGHMIQLDRGTRCQ